MGEKDDTALGPGKDMASLQKTIENTISNGGSFPMEVEFVRHKKMSKNGNEYNVLSIAVINSGDDVTLPDVPEDQLEEWTPEDDE